MTNYTVWLIIDPTFTGEVLPEEFSQYRSRTSFYAGLKRAGLMPALAFPIWDIRAALEEPPPPNGSNAMDCRIWVASEWIIQCARLLFIDLGSSEELDEAAARGLQTGPLCGDNDKMAPLSVARWEFWKTRLSEIASQVGSSGLTITTAERISKALEAMDAAEKV